MEKSPLHFRHVQEHPEPSTPGQLLGRLLHTLALEPERFDADYAIFPGEVRKGKEWQAFKAANAGKSIVKEGEIETVRLQAAAVRRHPAAHAYLRDAVVEQSIFWDDPRTRIACKARPDLWHPRTRTLIDLKGCPSVDARHFGRVAAQNLYFAQLAHYKSGLEVTTGGAVFRVALLAVENKPPFDVALFRLSADDLDTGRGYVDSYLDRLKECLDSGQYPGRYPEETPINLPGWISGDGEVMITMEGE
jgi:hypothetical protein